MDVSEAEECTVPVIFHPQLLQTIDTITPRHPIASDSRRIHERANTGY